MIRGHVHTVRSSTFRVLLPFDLSYHLVEAIGCCCCFGATLVGPSWKNTIFELIKLSLIHILGREDGTIVARRWILTATSFTSLTRFLCHYFFHTDLDRVQVKLLDDLSL